MMIHGFIANLISLGRSLVKKVEVLMETPSYPDIKTISSEKQYDMPEYARVEAEKYKIEFLKRNSEAAQSVEWRFYYDESEDACLECTVIGKKNYSWPTPKWIAIRWGREGGQVGNGKINFVLTRKKADEAQWRMKQRRREALFQELEALVLGVAREYDYDFQQAYGIKVKYRGQKKLAVCDGYANATRSALGAHPQVLVVEKWVSLQYSHAWNVVRLKDGRRLYCDTTWYDGQGVDVEGYVISEPERNPVNLTYEESEFNSLGGAINTTTRSTLAVHFLWKDARQVD